MKKLLIVDDQVGIRMLLKEVFKLEGYDIILASNGNEALLHMASSMPDCVLMDMKMPGLNGNEVLRNIKDTNPEIPVVMMTAYDEIEIGNHETTHRADYYFTKPFDIHEVRSTINQLLKET